MTQNEPPNTEGSGAKVQPVEAIAGAPGSETEIRREMGLPPRPPISVATLIYIAAAIWVLIVLAALIYASAQTGSYPNQYLTK